MALDPSIALQVQPAQIQNPLTAYAQVAGIQNAQQQNQLTGLAIQQAQRQQTQSDALNNAFKAPGAVNADGTLNSSGILTNVANAGAGSAIPALSKQLTEATTAQLGQQKAKVDNALQQVGAIGQVLNGVTDQQSYDAARQWAATHLGQDAVANMPAQFNPQLVAQKQREALTVVQQLDQHSKAIDQALQQSQFGETQRHNTATEASTTRGQDLTAATETRGQNLRALDYDATNGVVVNKATGQTMQIPGISGSQKLTQDQGNAVAFGARALDAQTTLRQLEAGGVTSGNRLRQAVGGVPVIGGALASGANALPTALGGASDQQQSYEQAQRNFVSAVLRKESGAAISNEEYANEAQKYFPQPGDSASTIEQKARARDLAIEGLKAQAGPGASLIPGIISSANQDYSQQPRAGQQQQAPAAQSQSAAPVAPDAALAELRRRAASNPALAARLQAMGH